VAIRLLDKNIQLIPGNAHMLRLARLSRGLKEYWLMICIAGLHSGKCYIEEYVPTTVSFSEDIYGHFKFIQDDEEAEELARFCQEHKLSDIAERSSEMVESGLGHIVFGGYKDPNAWRLK
jgi:hypothetical protein